MNVPVIYEDENVLAVNKPAGLLMHGVRSKDKEQKADGKNEPTLVDWLLEHYPEIKGVGDDPEHRPGLVHRLDKDTSGIVLVAKNQRYFEYLKRLFKEHAVKKTYRALVYGKLKMPKGVIDKPISIKGGTIKRTVFEGKMTKEAITEYKVVKEYRNDDQVFSLLEVAPRTGRTHQIRIHMAAIGHPIVGDPLYGPKANPFGLTRQFLHAQSLEFSIGERRVLKLEAELPDDLKKVSNTLSELSTVAQNRDVLK